MRGKANFPIYPREVVICDHTFAWFCGSIYLPDFPFFFLYFFFYLKTSVQWDGADSYMIFFFFFRMETIFLFFFTC